MPFPGKRQRLFAIQPVDALRYPHRLMPAFIGGILTDEFLRIVDDHAAQSIDNFNDAVEVAFKVEIHVDVQQLFHRINRALAAAHAGIVDLIRLLIGIAGDRHIAVTRDGRQQHRHAARIDGRQHQRVAPVVVHADDQHGERLFRHILIAALLCMNRQRAVEVMHIAQRRQLRRDFLICFKHSLIVFRQGGHVDFLVQQPF